MIYVPNLWAGYGDHYRSTHYDSGIGRFMSEDPDPGELGSPFSFTNPYGYVANNPVLNIDPSGRIIFTSALIFSVAGSFAASSAGAIALSAFAVGAFSVLSAGEAQHGYDTGAYISSNEFGGDIVDAVISGGAAAAFSYAAYGPLKSALRFVENPVVRAGLFEGSVNAIGSAGATAGFYLSRAASDRLEPGANPFKDILTSSTMSFVASFGVRYLGGFSTAGRIISIKQGTMWMMFFSSKGHIPEGETR